MSVSASVLKGMDTSIATQIRVITDQGEFAKMGKSWRLLLKRSGLSNIYLTYDWLYTWWLRFSEQSSFKLSIVCVFYGELLIAIAPFYIEQRNTYRIASKRILRLLGQRGSTSDSEKLDIIIDKRYEYQSIIAEALDHYLKKEGLFSSLVFHGVAQESFLYELIKQLPQLSIGSSSKKNSAAFSVTLTTSFDEFIANQSLSWRSRYRSHKKIMTMTGGVEVRVANKVDNIHSGLQSLSQIMCVQQRKSFDGKCSFDTDSYMNFHEDICHLLSISGCVEIISLIMDGRLLASACYYHHNNIFQVYQMASIKGEGIHFSPMLLLMTEIIKQAINQRMSRIDFHSSYTCTELEQTLLRGDNTSLYRLEWHTNRSNIYFIGAAKKLYNALKIA